MQEFDVINGMYAMVIAADRRCKNKIDPDPNQREWLLDDLYDKADTLLQYALNNFGGTDCTIADANIALEKAYNRADIPGLLSDVVPNTIPILLCIKLIRFAKVDLSPIRSQVLRTYIGKYSYLLVDVEFPDIED